MTKLSWSKLFREGREEIEDKARPGRPITETTAENIEEVRLFIDDDPRITIEDIQEQTNLSYEPVQRIIGDHLKLRKITARYVPKDLTDRQRAERVRICKQNLAKIHHDNGRPHVHKDVIDFLESEGFMIIEHPAHSPD